jgi:arginine N-succinyltransferase
LTQAFASQGFLTLPVDKKELGSLLELSQTSFDQTLSDPDQAKYLFVLEDLSLKRVVGTSLIIARHGTSDSPHIYFQVDPAAETLELKFETSGRTELGGLILDPAYRGHPEKLGKKLSYARLAFISRHPERFKKDLLAELRPPLSTDGTSPFWEALGKKFTGMEYQQADRLSRAEDEEFVKSKFPQEKILIRSLPSEARQRIGKVATEAEPVVKILTAAGFQYLNQVDPFDGGPHYGAQQKEIRQDLVEGFLLQGTNVKCHTLF